MERRRTATLYIIYIPISTSYQKKAPVCAVDKARIFSQKHLLSQKNGGNIMKLKSYKDVSVFFWLPFVASHIPAMEVKGMMCTTRRTSHKTHTHTHTPLKWLRKPKCAWQRNVCDWPCYGNASFQLETHIRQEEKGWNKRSGRWFPSWTWPQLSTSDNERYMFESYCHAVL